MFSFFIVFRMTLFETDPFNFLLEEAECAAAARAPFVVLRIAQARGFEYVNDSGFIDASLAEGEFHNHILGFCRIPFAILLVGSDCHIGENFVSCSQPWLDPLLEWRQFKLAGTPASLRAREEMVEFTQPKAKVAAGIKPFNGFAQIAFESP
ncbi:hypothetical protein AW928_14330 [Pseudomonas aeruginosa]|nr:hypothetical protein AW928_14330 [Pseudomonas aeruginosa]KXE62536.1 hypothetical protein AW929_13905 [Pseudomonas aeruginosa]KXE75549.1 hypothetical protein AW931_13920 [Pseudomonas aeruginosa]